MLLELILAQVTAWNKGNLDDFLSYYRDDVKVYSQTANDLIFDSKAALLPHIKPDFDSGKVERVHIVDQFESPPYVLLLEEKTNESGSRRAVVTYLIENNKIKSMWIERIEIGVSLIPKSSIQNAVQCKSVLGG